MDLAGSGSDHKILDPNPASISKSFRSDWSTRASLIGNVWTTGASLIGSDWAAGVSLTDGTDLPGRHIPMGQICRGVTYCNDCSARASPTAGTDLPGRYLPQWLICQCVPYRSNSASGASFLYILQGQTCGSVTYRWDSSPVCLLIGPSHRLPCRPAPCLHTWYSTVNDFTK